MSKECRIGILKLGCIGAAPLLDLLLDERAERKDIDVVTVGSGAKLDSEPCEVAASKMSEYDVGLVIIVSPNASLPGPTKAREMIIEKGIPVLTISDGPSQKAFYKKNEEGKKVVTIPEKSGFIVLPMDPMIGARKEFLDPTEMALFNAELIKILSCTGVLRFIQNTINKLVESLKSGKELELPTVVLKTEKALDAAGFSNPYAYAKAFAALRMTEMVAEITSNACFKESDHEKYIPEVAAAHELLRAAARLSDEAREIEKYNDSVLRTSHSSSGKIQKKTELHQKPE